jgi:curved DNA-binding protein CbpA
MLVDEKLNIRSYVFRKIRESKAKDRIDEADASINKRNQYNLNEARVLIQILRKDPFKTVINNIDLQYLIR